MIDYTIKLLEENDVEGIVRLAKSTEKQVRFYNEKIEIIKEWNELIMHIFMAKGKKTISMEVDSPDKRKIKCAVERGIKLLPKMADVEFYGIEERNNFIDDKVFDESVIENDVMLSIAEDAINAGGEAGTVYSSIEEMEIANTNGSMNRDKNSMIYLSVRAFHYGSSGHEVSCSRSASKINALVAENAKEMAKKGVKARKGKEGKYDVILSPLAFANLLSNLAFFSSAFYVDSGYSFLAGKTGKKVASSELSIYDSGIERDGMFSRKFDDEGISTQETPVIENGILKSYLHNSTTAHRHGVRTTGNAGIVAPQPWNTVVGRGDKSMEELMEIGRDIIYITNVWYTRFQNYMTGDFSTVARDAAFHIRNGEWKAIKQIRISDNMEKMLKNIEGVAKDAKQIFWWEVENPVFAPHVLIRDVNITTA